MQYKNYMQHRYSQRWPLKVDVELYFGSCFLGRFKTRDISLQGLFVETGPLQVRPNDFLFLQFTDTPRIGGNAESVIGQVARCTPEGIGILLDESSPILGALLRQFLAFETVTSLRLNSIP